MRRSASSRCLSGILSPLAVTAAGQFLVCSLSYIKTFFIDPLWVYSSWIPVCESECILQCIVIKAIMCRICQFDANIDVFNRRLELFWAGRLLDHANRAAKNSTQMGQSQRQACQANIFGWLRGTTGHCRDGMSVADCKKIDKLLQNLTMWAAEWEKEVVVGVVVQVWKRLSSSREWSG